MQEAARAAQTLAEAYGSKDSYNDDHAEELMKAAQALASAALKTFRDDLQKKAMACAVAMSDLAWELERP